MESLHTSPLPTNNRSDLASITHNNLLSHQAAWTKVATQSEVKEAGGKKVVEVGGQRVLLVETGDGIYAVSNKCSHLGLPLVGKTAMFQAEITADKCVKCPAHDTKFDLATGEVKGEKKGNRGSHALAVGMQLVHNLGIRQIPREV